MSERETVKLSRPIEFGKETITELHFRRGCAGDMRGVKVGGNGVEIDDLYTIASRMCGQPVAVIHKLDEDDAGEALGRAMDFFGKCLATGRRLSAFSPTSSTSHPES